MKKLIIGLIIFGFSYPVFAQEQKTFTSFDLADPIVQPPKPEKIYNKMWLKSFVVSAASPTQPAQMEAVFVPYDGLELDPNGKEVFVRNENLFELASRDQDIAMSMELTFRALKKLGIRQGIFKAPDVPVEVDKDTYGTN